MARPLLRTCLIILLIVLAIGISPVEALDEIVDDYEDTAQVNVTYQVIHNATLDVMELNYTAGAGGGIEDLTTWIEVDTPGDLTVNSSFVQFTTMRRDSDSLIYRDFGVGFFLDFTYNFTHVFSGDEAGDGSNVASYWAVALGNSPTKVGLVAGQMVGVEMGQLGLTDNRVRYRLVQRKAGAWTIQINDVTYYSPFTHYCSLSRIGATLTLDVYTDQAHTNRIEHMTSGGADLDGYQYAHASIGYDSPGDPADHASGYIGNIDFGFPVSGYDTDGYFTTTNLLNGLSYNATVILTNTSIPSGSINAEISPDGLTWTDLGALDAGYMALDLRTLGLVDSILRFNLTRGLATETPRLHQIRLIHEGPGAGAGVPGTGLYDATPWVAIGIILALSMYLLADRSRK